MDMILIQCGFVVMIVMVILLIIICIRISEIADQLEKIEYKISYRDWNDNFDEKMYTAHRR